jgi:hypothetical protein
MFIFGWGKSSTEIAIPNNSTQSIISTFAYFHIGFILRLTFARQWYLVSKSDPKSDGETTITQKRITKTEVNNLLGKNPVNLFWIIFNQSLLWLILGALVVSGFGNLIKTGNPTVAPTKTVTEIINSEYWTTQEQDLVVKTATDEEFTQFLSKFRREFLLKEAIKSRQQYIKSIKANSSISNTKLKTNQSISN